MTRTPITDEVVTQLGDALDHEEVDHPLNRGAVQYAAWQLDLETLATFIGEADAATYYEALKQAGIEPRPGGQNEGGYDPEIDG